SRRRHTRFSRDWSSDVCSSDLPSLREMLLDDPEDFRGLRDRLLVWRERIEEIRLRFQPLGDFLRDRNWSKMAGEMVAIAGALAQIGRASSRVRGSPAGVNGTSQ